MSTEAAVERECQRLRSAQAKKVMPLVGGLIDEWEGLSNDARQLIDEEALGLAHYLNKISAALGGEKL